LNNLPLTTSSPIYHSDSSEG